MKEGNLVVIKTGGMLMTVERVRGDGKSIECVWFVNGDLHRDNFHPDTLMKVAD